MRGPSTGGMPAVPGAEPAEGRDRISVHLIWEGVLALLAVGLLIGTAAMTPSQNITSALNQAGYIGLVATGLAFSLRTRSPNLAIGAITAFTATLSAHLITNNQWGKPGAFLLAIVLATLIGFVLGVLVAVLSVPAWAATLVAAAIIQAVTLSFFSSGGFVIPVRFEGQYPTALWYGLFVVISVGGGALWLLPAIRGPLSAGRRSGDPGEYGGLRTGLGAIAGLTGSAFLGGLAAIPMLMRLQSVDPSASSTTTTALAAVLLGGVSVFGRRAGVFGTFLAVTIVMLVQTLIAFNDASLWVSTLVLGIIGLIGVGVGRGLESFTDMLNRRPKMSYPMPPPSPPALPPGRA
jgi:ribose/xylose/arabinose/galactoside ABC-type transport system permease subunit